MKRLIRFLCALFIVFAACGSPLYATDKPVLKWGGDTEGGVPYMFYDPFDMDRLVGYEVEIIDAIADYLSIETEFAQNGWDNLIPGLERHL